MDETGSEFLKPIGDPENPTAEFPKRSRESFRRDILVSPAGRNVSPHTSLVFPKNSVAAEIIQALASGVGGLSEKASKRIAVEIEMRISRNARTASRTKLRGYLTRASWVAAAIHSDKVPVPSDQTEQSLIDSGHAFVAAVESTSRDFAMHGVAPEDVARHDDIPAN